MKSVVAELVRRTRRKPQRWVIKYIRMSGADEVAPEHSEGACACWCLPEVLYGEEIAIVLHRRFEN